MKGFTTHIIRQGDTLQRIAVQYNVDHWQDIATLNGLEYPFIDDSIYPSQDSIENERVKLIGDTIIVPTDYETLVKDMTQETLEIETYGCDLDILHESYNTSFILNLESTGELLSDTEEDLKTVKGYLNLKQALMIRLSTPRGTLPLHPEYGSDVLKFIGGKKSYRNLIKCKLEIEKTLMEDFRVEKIKDVKVEGIDTGVRFSCLIKPINMSPWMELEGNIAQEVR